MEASNLPPAGRMQPRGAVNAAQHKIVNLLKTLWDYFVITCRNVFNVWPKTTLLLPVCPRDTKSLESKVWLVWLSELSTGLQTRGSLVRFPVRTQAWVAGQVLIRGRAKGNHTLMFLSLSFSLPSPLSKNKINKIFFKKSSKISIIHLVHIWAYTMF